MEDNVIGVIAVFVVVSGAALIAWAIYGRQRLRELAMRERLALIERGLVPSPESDPAGFERVLGAHRQRSPRSLRYRSAGVLLMGLGAAFFVLLTFTADRPEVGFGVGGGIAVLGLAVFINGTLLSRDDTVDVPPRTPATPSARPAVASEPPTNVAP